MSAMSLRRRPRVCYWEPDEPAFDEYVFCSQCSDYVLEYCSLHGALLVVPDDKVPIPTGFPSFVPRAALTIPSEFLHIAPSTIQGAGLGVFSSRTLPRDVRFGPYRGVTRESSSSSYCWQLYDGERRASVVVDARDAARANWMRYVNCARHFCEQNLAAYQYRGQLYYRTIKVVPRFTELLVFYGSEFALSLRIDLTRYNDPTGYTRTVVLDRPIIVNTNAEPRQVERNARGREKETMQVVDNICADLKADITDEKSKNQSENENNTLIGDDFKVKETFDVPKTDLYICNDCNECFIDKASLIVHVATHITKAENVLCTNETYSCQKCSSKFATKSQLINHDIHEHNSTTKHYACNKCDYKTDTNYKLKMHTKIHTGESQNCSVCDYRTSVSNYLKRHMRTHTGEKPHCCSVCNYKCAHSTRLKMHMRRHTGEKPNNCSFCDYKCISKTTLKRHVMNHTGEKPFCCSVCDYKTSSADRLKIHVRIHTGEKPYCCTICDYKTTSSTYLKRHVRRHIARENIPLSL